jgi:hypothetical protein
MLLSMSTQSSMVHMPENPWSPMFVRNRLKKIHLDTGESVRRVGKTVITIPYQKAEGMGGVMNSSH